MIAGRESTLRVLADGLIHQADMLPRQSDAARHLREAAASLLDADMAMPKPAPPARQAA